jgi:hypothetical protein
LFIYSLAWANPNAGPSQDDRTSNAWRWVYPAGFAAILVASLISRARNTDADSSDEDDAKMSKLKNDRAVRMHKAMERLDFATRTPEAQAKMSQDYE